MKRKILISLLFIALSLALTADHIGQIQLSDPHRAQTQRSGERSVVLTAQSFNQGLSRGEFALIRDQADSFFPGRIHQRYQQLHNGLQVFGGTVIIERDQERIIAISGQYYPISRVDLTEAISPEQAFERFADELGAIQTRFEPDSHRRVIYPEENGEFRLCHQITITVGPSHNETALIDARDGTIYARDSNLKFDTRIGIGTDYHGINRKFPHSYENGIFYLWDDKVVRPVKLATYDMRSGGYVAQGNSEFWQGNGTNISAHYNVGLAYDFLYLFLGRRGFDDNNRDALVVTHRSEYTDNASWNGVSVNFYRTGNQNAQYAAALDVVAHECAHAVTQFSSNLVYSYESGALNESFSDIIGAAAELYWHPAGTGLFHADWYIGEDAYPSYSHAINHIGRVRYLADPNQFSQFQNPSLPDPCHLSQFYTLPFSTDRGGVHINMTIYSHAFYLLTAGGTNRISGKSVSGLGLEKALRIFYRAWVYKLTENSNFLNAAQALLNSAAELFGDGSNEYTQTIRAMEAIGWTVN